MPASPIRESHTDATESLNSPAPMRRVRRRIDRQSGRALEILGHAIEYLTDEYVFDLAKDEAPPLASDGPVKAIQLLMSINREIYFQCPEVEDLATRCLSILHGRRRKRSDSGAAVEIPLHGTK